MDQFGDINVVEAEKPTTINTLLTDHRTLLKTIVLICTSSLIMYVIL